MKVAVYTIARDEALVAERWCESNGDADYRLVVVDQATQDNTAGLLHDAGVHVINVDYGEMGGFRYDHARNHALSHLPDDIDVCVVQDLDEVLGNGFLEQLRTVWDEAHAGFVWYDATSGGVWSRSKRVHVRHGYRWAKPCHEVLLWDSDGERVVDLELTMSHRQLTKDRSHRLDLLRLAVEEDPTDARMWHYLSRDALAAGQPDVALKAAVTMLELPDGWPAERAAACRYAAEADVALERLDWLTRGTIEGPDEAEAWFALADLCRLEENWHAAYHNALVGLHCPLASHYLTNHYQRSCALHDIAALAAHHLDRHEAATYHGCVAHLADLEDERLLDNLRWYVKGYNRN